MIGSTAGTWLNVTTTVVFQMAFAAVFGTSGAASAFFVSLVSAISLAYVLTGTVHVIALPRLLATDGAIHRGQLRFIAGVALLAIIIGIAVAVLADRLPVAVVTTDGADLARAAAAYFVTRVIATLISTIALARGHRFWPAAGPAIPSIVAVLYLLWSYGTPSATATMTFLALGSGIQIVVLLLVSVRRLQVVPGALRSIRAVTIGTAAQLALLMIIPPLQLIMSTVDSVSGAATAQYGLQGLQTGQMLLIGGLASAAFADWARQRSREEQGMALASTTAFGALLLVVAGAAGAVAAPTIVRAVFQRGTFTSADTEAVVAVVRLAVIGFVAEGITTIVLQMVVATQHNWIAIRLGFFRFALMAALTIAGGFLAGANGVAIASSVGAVCTLVLAWPAAFRLVTVQRQARHTLIRAAWAGAGVVLVAVLVSVLVPGLPDIVQAIVVLLGAGIFILALRLPVRQWRLT